MPEGLLKLSTGGLRVLRLCNGQNTVSEIVRLLQAEHAPELSSRIEQETLSFLRRLFDRRILDSP
ncbi:MAG: PqqD family peptide modification chaperone [Bdellovibrionales bacterium]